MSDNSISKAAFLRWFKPILTALKDLGGSAAPDEVRAKIIDNEHVNYEELQIVIGKSNTNKFANEVAWARNYLVMAGYVDKSVRGVWSLTDAGYAVEMTDELASEIFKKGVKGNKDMQDLQNQDSSNSSIGNTWLFTWNPTKLNWEDYDEAISLTRSGNGYCIGWNCANRHAQVGDRIFMIKLGDNSTPRGIFASGYIMSEFWEDEHYNGSKDSRIMYVDIMFTKILDYRTDNIITIDKLNQMFPEQKWSPQGSGIVIKPDAARWLIDNWERLHVTDNVDTISPDGESPVNAPVIWKISHGTNRRGISEHLRGTFEAKRIVVVNSETPSLVQKKNTSQGKTFMQEIRKGDYFYLCYAGEIALFGQFTEDEAKLNTEMDDERYDADWYERSYRLLAHSKDHSPYKGKKKLWTSNFNSTCVKVDDNELFEELILEPYFGLTLADLKYMSMYEPYNNEDFLKDVFLTEIEYNRLRSLVIRKKNIILQGAPGVGKTYSAKRLAYSIIGEKNDSRICMVQFHQNYSYEDFIMGYRPNDLGGFDLQEGVFYDFCEKCKDHPDQPYFFIIDEINRGNLSKIFGELLMLIETDKRGEHHKINLVYGGTPFYIPDNLHIIGMMNTADRSLAMIDYALRRRFSFYTMQPAFDNADTNGFGEYTADIACEMYHTVITKIKKLNNAIRTDSSLGKGFEIGHSYFAPENKTDIDDEWVRNVVEYEIIPLIEEYWFDDDKKTDEWKKALYQALGEAYDG